MDIDLQAIVNSSKKIMEISKSQLERLDKSNSTDEHTKEILNKSYQTAMNTFKIINDIKGNQPQESSTSSENTPKVNNSSDHQLTREKYRQSLRNK